MACRFEVTLPMSDRAGLAIARRALAQVDLHEQQLTIFNETSQLSHINRNAALHPVPAQPSLFALLLLCQELARETQGAFDITSGPLSYCWGFLRRDGRLPQQHEIDAARYVVGSDLLLLDRASQTVHFQRPGVCLNLGSIGKGYALDRIAASMQPAVRSALLSAGSSSMRAIGTGNHPSGWTVGVRHPSRESGRLAVLRMRDCAMATSGCEEQFFEHNGVRYGHIIDPRSGQPATQVLSATVVAASAAVADALATAFFVCGPDLAEQYCLAHPDVLAIILPRGASRPIVIGNGPRCEVRCEARCEVEIPR
jgi:thiamine biosynthesis lipoprotein